MTKIERRFATVKLHQGHYQQALADLVDEMMSALRDEESGASPQRHGTTSKANELALQHDALMKEADETATTVKVYALRFDQMEELQDEHPTRDDEDRDRIFGVNMKTFPKALTAASLVPGDADDLEDLRTKGAAALADLGLSMPQYRKVEAAAWNVNVGDDDIPKESLVSLLKQARDPDSKPPPDSESAPQSSTVTSRPKRRSTSTSKATSPDEPSSPDSPTGQTPPAPAP